MQPPSKLAPTASPDVGVNAFRASLRARMLARGVTVVTQPPKPKIAPTGIGPQLTLEQLLDVLYEDGASEFPLSTSQRALARAADGYGTSAFAWAKDGRDTTADIHAYHFGTATPLPIIGVPPRVVYLRAGIRSGKTYIASMGVLKCALTCLVRRPLTEAERTQGRRPDPDGMVAALQPGEWITVFFCTPKAIQSQKAFEYVRSALMGSPRLATLITINTAERIRIRRPHDGIDVDFRMEAMSPRGSNLRSGWLAAALFDESAFMDDDEEAAITLRDNVTAATSRLLPGGQVWEPSSPWADSGTWHDDIERLMRGIDGAANGDASSLAFHSDSYTLNPALNPKLRAEAEKKDTIEAQREYDAVPISALTNLFFPPAAIKRAVNVSRTADSGSLTLPPIRGIPHYAGVDLGYRKNSSTLAVARNEPRGTDAAGTPFLGPRDVAVIVYHEELIPPKNTPLMPSMVTSTFAARCQEYGAHTMRGDSYDTPSAVDALRQVQGPVVSYDEYIPTLERNTALFTRALERMAEGVVELPNDPRLLGQLKRVQKRIKPGGVAQIVLPKQGRAHADLVVAVVHAIVQAADWSSSGASLEYDASYDRYLEGFGRSGHMDHGESVSMDDGPAAREMRGTWGRGGGRHDR